MPVHIDYIQAIILGIVEGLTEFLPVSSTGHLILASHWLGLPGDSDGVKAFEIVIQSGALLAVFGIYLPSIRLMLRGVFQHDPAGLKLLSQLFVAFLPAAVVGLLIGDWIKARLFGVWPVAAALAVGGVLMIGVEYFRIHRSGGQASFRGLRGDRARQWRRFCGLSVAVDGRPHPHRYQNLLRHGL